MRKDKTAGGSFFFFFFMCLWMQCVGWRKAREAAESSPERDLGAQYQSRALRSHKISTLHKAKREGCKSAAICTLPNCVYPAQMQHTHRNTRRRRDYAQKAAKWDRVGPYRNQLACQTWEVIRRNGEGDTMLQCAQGLLNLLLIATYTNPVGCREAPGVEQTNHFKCEQSIVR